MSLDREAIYAALFTRLQNLTGIVTASRVWKHWDDVDVCEQPALYLAQGSERPIQQRGTPPQWTLTPTIYLYVRATEGDPYAAPGTKLNALIKAIEGALERKAADVAPYGGPEEWSTTLGGLCSHCKISGTIETDEGLLGNQSVAVIPIEILATS